MRQGLLIIGCGEIGLRIVEQFSQNFRIFALIRDPEKAALIRAKGGIPVLADLDHKESLFKLTHLAKHVIHLAPPQNHGPQDLRTRRLATILPEPSRCVYISTTGVYGDCQGQWCSETSSANPDTERGMRRLDAERTLRNWAKRTNSCLSILRVPAIYAESRLPLKHLQQRLPALNKTDDVFVNHIHADDLVHIIIRTLFRGRPQRIYNVADDQPILMGDYFDKIADAKQLARPERVSKLELPTRISTSLLGFMSASRKVSNQRMKEELGITLRYPCIDLTCSTTMDAAKDPVLRIQK